MSKNAKGRKRKLPDLPVVQKKRKTLSDQIAELTDPTPQDFDIEEPHWDSAQTNYDEYEQQDFTSETSHQFKQVPAKKRLVSDIVMGPEYRGKRISRRNLFDADSDKEEEVLSGEEPTPPSHASSFNINLDESSSDDLDRDDDKEDDEDHNQGWEENDEEEVIRQESDQGLARQIEADNLEKQFTTITNQTLDAPVTANLENQRKKAFHTMNQCAIWDTMVDLRINFQNLLDMGNRLPSPPDHVAFVGDPLVRDKFFLAQNAVHLLFGSLVKLQESLLVRDPVVKIPEFSELLSEKLEWEYLFQIQKKIEECSGPILDKWHTKALLPSTTVNRNQTLRLKSINQNITQQVSSTLSGNNLSNLIQRSQIVPEDSKKIFGALPTPTQPHIGVTPHTPDDNVPLHLPSVKSKPEKKYSGEIYNDEEFYTQIMREHIQSGIKGMGSTDDPIKMSQQYLQLRQLKKRKNHKSSNKDTKASKGRKLRYQVHDRLASFMAPQSQWYARQDSVLVERLFKSMFGSSGVTVRSKE